MKRRFSSFAVCLSVCLSVILSAPAEALAQQPVPKITLAPPPNPAPYDWTAHISGYTQGIPDGSVIHVTVLNQWNNSPSDTGSYYANVSATVVNGGFVTLSQFTFYGQGGYTISASWSGFSYAQDMKYGAVQGPE